MLKLAVIAFTDRYLFIDFVFGSNAVRSGMNLLLTLRTLGILNSPVATIDSLITSSNEDKTNLTRSLGSPVRLEISRVTSSFDCKDPPSWLDHFDNLMLSATPPTEYINEISAQLLILSLIMFLSSSYEYDSSSSSVAT